MGAILTELLAIFPTILGFLNPENEKHVGLRISLFFNIAFIALFSFLVIKVEPYVVECGKNKAKVEAMKDLVTEERSLSTRFSGRIDKLEDLIAKLIDDNKK